MVANELTKQEIIDIMLVQKKSASNINKYRLIYQQATGNKFKGCLCGNGFNLLYKTCHNFANKIKNEKK